MTVRGDAGNFIFLLQKVILKLWQADIIWAGALFLSAKMFNEYCKVDYFSESYHKAKSEAKNKSILPKELTNEVI